MCIGEIFFSYATMLIIAHADVIHTHSGTKVDSYSFKRSGNAAILHGLFSQRYLVKGTCRAMRRRVESTSGSKDGWGLLYRPTSAKAVTRREPPFGLFTRKEGFRYSTVIPTSSGRWKTPSCSRWSNVSWSSTGGYCGHIGGGGLSAVGARQDPS